MRTLEISSDEEEETNKLISISEVQALGKDFIQVRSL